MTVVIGAVVGGHVWLAGDSYCGDDDVVEYCSEPKVFSITNTVIMGSCGDFRAEVLVTKAIKTILSNKKRITDEWLKSDFGLKLHEKLKDSGVLRDDKGIHALADSEYILAHAGRLYYLEADLSLWSPREPYAAIGAGRDMALSVMSYANISGDLARDPEATVQKAMQAVAKHNNKVRPPYTYLKI